MKQLLLSFILVFLPILINAETVEINGIYYDLSAESKTAEVTSNPNGYSGKIDIPASFKYKEMSYSVTSIGDYVFSHCYYSLTSISIPNSVKSIGEYAFQNCWEMTSITIPNSVTNIGMCAFEGCSSLTSIIISNSVKSIESGVFHGCRSLTSINIPNSVTKIGGSAFNDCSSLTTITIPNSVTKIGDSAFSGCSSLTTITIPNSVSSIEGGAFAGCSSLSSITIPNNVTSIEDMVFAGCSSLSSITIPNNVTSIGERAFEGCSNLSSITIPHNVTSIEGGAFLRTKWLDNQPEGLVYAGKVAYTYKGIMPKNTKIVLKEGTLGIGGGAFEDCSGLYSIVIPNSVISIGSGAICGCNGLTTIQVENGNPVYDSRDNCNAIIKSENNELIAGCKKTVIPNSVTCIGDGAFYYCDSLTSISIPNSVASIRDYAFYRCTGLTSFIIPNSVATIGEKAFEGCTSLTSISISDGVIDIGYCAFRDCSSLSSIVIPNSITRIEDGILQDCRGLTSVTIPSSVTSIGEKAFKNCDNLTSVNIFDIAAWCRIQYEIYHGTERNNPLFYAHHLYLNGKEVKNLVIPDGVTSIGKYAFEYCWGLTSITIPNSVTSIGKCAFRDCDSLISVISYIEDPFTVDDAFPSWDEHGNNNIILYVPIGTKAKYEETSGWWNKNGYNRFKNIVEMDIQPVEDGQTIDIGDEIDENTNLDGNIMGNIYFSIRDENGEYNPAEGCIIIKKPSDDSDIDGKDIFGEDFKDSYTGIVFKVGAGKGVINMQAQTTGNMVLKVKIGDGEPVEIELEGKMNISIPYNVSQDTYVYIYGGLNTSNAKGMRKAESADGTLKIYGIEVERDTNGIELTDSSSYEISTIYDMNGYHIYSPQRGINIVRMSNGTTRKVVVK